MANIELRLITLLKIGAQSIFSVLLIRFLLKHELGFEQVMRPIVIAGYATFLELGISRSAVDYSVLEGKSYFKEFLGLLLIILFIIDVIILVVFGYSFYILVGVILLSLTVLNILFYQYQEYQEKTKSFQKFALLVFASFSCILWILGERNYTGDFIVYFVAILSQLFVAVKFAYLPSFNRKTLKNAKRYVLKNAIWAILLFSTISIAREFAILNGNLVSVEIGMKIGILISSTLVSATFHIYSQLAMNTIQDSGLLKTVLVKCALYVVVFIILSANLDRIVDIIFAVKINYWTTISFAFMFSFPTLFDGIFKWIQIDFKRSQFVIITRSIMLLAGLTFYILVITSNYYLIGQLIVVPILSFIYFIVRYDRNTI